MIHLPLVHAAHGTGLNMRESGAALRNHPTNRSLHAKPAQTKEVRKDMLFLELWINKTLGDGCGLPAAIII